MGNVIGMLDYATLIIISDVCLTIQAPVAEWFKALSRKQEISGSIPERAYFSISLYYSPTAKQLESNIYLFPSYIPTFSPMLQM